MYPIKVRVDHALTRVEATMLLWDGLDTLYADPEAAVEHRLVLNKGTVVKALRVALEYRGVRSVECGPLNEWTEDQERWCEDTIIRVFGKAL